MRALFRTDNGQILLWDITHNCAIFTLTNIWGSGYPGDQCGVLSEDGERIISITERGKATKVWNAQTGREICTITRTNRGYFTSAQFSPDAKTAITASFDDDPTEKKKVTLDGSWFFLGANSGSAQLWDANTGKLIRVLRGHTNLVCRATFIGNGNRVVTASYDGSARLWDANTGKELRQFWNPDRVEQMVISADGKRLITRWMSSKSDEQGTVTGAVLWDVETGRQLLQLTNRSEEIAGFSPVDKTFMTVSDGKPAALWDGATGKKLRDYEPARKP